jgi:MFS family permease
VVAESWLNDRATNETRGQLLSVYMVVSLGGMASGQYLLGLGDPGSFELFVLVSVMVSISLLPILLTVSPAPDLEGPRRVGILHLYRVSPLGMVGVTLTGLAHGAFFGMGAVYAVGIGFSIAEVSVFMSAGILGGVALQWPIGSLSDRFDRRVVLTTVTTIAMVAALGAVLPWSGQTWMRIALVALYGGMALPMYSLCIAHTNDYLSPDELIGASAGLVLMAGVGAVFGPLTAAAVMAATGDLGFFLFLALVHGAIAVFAIYRMARRDTVPIEERGNFVAMPVRASPIAAGLSPEAEEEPIDPQD